MARTKTSTLAKKAERLALEPRRNPYFESLGGGASIGYRRTAGAGTWVARRSDGAGGKAEKALGLADDYAPADGVKVLSWPMAQAAALAYDPTAGKASDTAAPPVTVSLVLERYAADIRTRGGDVGNATRLRHHLPENVLNKAVTSLTVTDLRGWRDGLVKTLAPSSVNRTSTVLKAALNSAADADQGVTITSRAPWEIGLKTLADAEESRNVVIPDSEIAKIVGAAYGQSHGFGMLVEVLAVTGSRYSQVAALTVGDLLDSNGEPRLMVPTSKKGKGTKRVLRRPVPVPKSLTKKLREAAGDRPDGAPLLVHSTGDAWAHAEQARPFRAAVLAAGLDMGAIHPFALEEMTTYMLRHSSIVRDLLRNVPVRLVAAKHDTSVSQIERTYSKYISDHADGISRGAMVDLGEIVTIPPVSTAPEREPMGGACRHGHSYAEFPPYRNGKGSVVCAECARQRTRKAKAARRV